MDIKDKLKQLSERAEKMLPSILTEEATKNALIMPFIAALGYDVFDPFEVHPEFVADIGIKKGEKVDYAILKNSKPIILIECKHHNEKLDPHNSQLFRYFHTTEAKFGLLTNGIIYRFYTDLEVANKMDEKPFLEISLLNLKDNLVEELKKFHKSYFDVEQILNSASELKYTNEIKTFLLAEYSNPSEDFVKFVSKKSYPGIMTAKVLQQFAPIVKKSFVSLVSDMITDRLTNALTKETVAITNENKEIAGDPLDTRDVDPKVNTTQEELEAYYVIRSILRGKIDIKRVFYRDAQSYFAILFDDNNRKTICRLFLTSTKKSIVILDEGKKETRIEIQSLDDLYNYADSLISISKFYHDGIISFA